MPRIPAIVYGKNPYISSGYDLQYPAVAGCLVRRISGGAGFEGDEGAVRGGGADSGDRRGEGHARQVRRRVRLRVLDVVAEAVWEAVVLPLLDVVQFLGQIVLRAVVRDEEFAVRAEGGGEGVAHAVREQLE